MSKWVPVIAGLVVLATSDAFAQGMGGGCPPAGGGNQQGGGNQPGGMVGGGNQQGGGNSSPCDPSQMGANMGCPWPDCVDMQAIMQACQNNNSNCEDMMDDCQQTMDECDQYSDCPFGEGMDDCDNSWVDQCGN